MDRAEVVGWDVTRGASPSRILAGSGKPRPSAIRSNRSSFSTCSTPRMMSLTLPWDRPHAMPICVWLAPAPLELAAPCTTLMQKAGSLFGNRPSALVAGEGFEPSTSGL